MKITHIGNLPVPDTGHDRYYLLRLAEDEPQTQEYVQEAFLHLVYREGSGPGQAFCHTVLVLPKNDTEFIGIAQVRYDV